VTVSRRWRSGLVGGFMQAQGHVQLVSALVDDGVDPRRR